MRSPLTKLSEKKLYSVLWPLSSGYGQTDKAWALSAECLFVGGRSTGRILGPCGARWKHPI